MKNSIIMLGFFTAGIVTGIISGPFDPGISLNLYALYVLLYLVGIGIGGGVNLIRIIKKVKLRILLVPLSVIIGTSFSVFLISFVISDIDIRESLAIGSGFGYYSLSSILISKIRGEVLGVIALLANISREIITLIFTPLFVRFFGKLAPIASGGATSMDTTLPVIMKYSGKEYAVISVFNGIILTVLVPLLVILVLK